MCAHAFYTLVFILATNSSHMKKEFYIVKRITKQQLPFTECLHCTYAYTMFSRQTDETAIIFTFSRQADALVTISPVLLLTSILGKLTSVVSHTWSKVKSVSFSLCSNLLMSFFTSWESKRTCRKFLLMSYRLL